MATAKFALRSTQLPAWYSLAGPTPGTYSSVNNDPTAITVDVNAGAFGGHAINFHNSGVEQRALVYPGFGNAYSTQAKSFLVRLIPTWTGAPGSPNALFTTGIDLQSLAGSAAYILSNGTVNWQVTGNQGATAFSFTSSAASFVSGVATDLLFTWDGTLAANGIKIYQDGVLIGQGTAGFNNFTVNPLISTHVVVGLASSSFAPLYLLNEFVLWDGVATVSYPRTDFIALSNFDATLNSDPGVANVLNGITYYAAGVLKTGSRQVILNQFESATLVAHANLEQQPVIEFTQGDSALLNLTAENGDGGLVDLTGATLSTQIKGPNGVIVTFPNSQHTILDQSTNLGKFTLALSIADTVACGIGNSKDIVTQVLQNADTTYFHGTGILNVVPSPPVQ